MCIRDRNNLFQVNVQVNKTERTSDLYTAELSLTVKETVFIEKINGKLFEKRRRNGIGSWLTSFAICTESQQLQAGQTYIFPFKFIKRPEDGTYKGAHIEILLEMQITIEYKKEKHEQASQKFSIKKPKGKRHLS